MRLEDKHKKFVVQGYACFMSRRQIVDAFMAEFNTEIYQLCTEDTSSTREIHEDLDEDLDEHLKTHGIPASNAEVNELAQIYSISGFAEIHLKREIVAKQKAAKAKLSARFRRFNITHSQFPQKYRALFLQTREEYLANYRTAQLNIPENLIIELEALYVLTRDLAFEKQDLKYIIQATQIIKTIAACNALNKQPNIQDVTPQDVKVLQDTGKTLTHQLKKETQQLAKHAIPADS